MWQFWRLNHLQQIVKCSSEILGSVTPQIEFDCCNVRSGRLTRQVFSLVRKDLIRSRWKSRTTPPFQKDVKLYLCVVSPGWWSNCLRQFSSRWILRVPKLTY